MRSVIYSMSVSLDGYIVGPDGSFDCSTPDEDVFRFVTQASKGSISTATRVLLRMGLVERVRFRGERFDRFRVQPEAWDEFFWRDEQFKTPRRVLRIGLDALAGEPQARRVRLEKLDAMYAWWQERMPKLREEYLAQRTRPARGAKRGRR
jgi:hypothetical protein